MDTYIDNFTDEPHEDYLAEVIGDESRSDFGQNRYSESDDSEDENIIDEEWLPRRNKKPLVRDRLSNSEHHLCYAHGLHLAVCDVLYNKKVSSKCHVYGCDSNYTTDERPDTAHEDVTTAEVGVDDCTDSDDGEYDETGGDLTTTLVMENHYDANLRQQIDLKDTSNGYECDISIASIIAKVRTAVKIFRKSPLKNEILQKDLFQQATASADSILPEVSS
ncbi:hypothetical protein Pmani_008953 [Petrolisthes manimaculis]|uniref:Uncharacterized protein n=1 Tax=Petrolisthes manimaculis TaxID=1843537 RepID=A0AAE1Q4N6_9EUCA|nr:hypothetical protein Pmani_008953 [Petrolisthes manimaculis]